MMDGCEGSVQMEVCGNRMGFGQLLYLFTARTLSIYLSRVYFWLEGHSIITSRALFGLNVGFIV